MARSLGRVRAHRKLGRLMDRLNEAGLRRALELGDEIVEEIRRFAPYDDRFDSDTTGEHLRDSYRSGLGLDRAGRARVEITTRRRYWAFVEFGTDEHGGPQPHVRPAIEAVRRRRD